MTVQRSLRAAALLVVAMASGACRRDFAEAVVPASAATLSLATRNVGDTAVVTLQLGGQAPSPLGSLTGEIAHESGAWTFAQCEAAQGDALLACKAHGATVRVAAAWAGGAHAGALVHLTFVRSSAAVAPAFMLAITEAHGARGTKLLDSIEVMRQSTTAGAPR